jgi:hypothetical protein
MYIKEADTFINKMVKGNNSEVIFNTTIQNRFSDLISLTTFVDHVYLCH